MTHAAIQTAAQGPVIDFAVEELRALLDRAGVVFIDAAGDGGPPDWTFALAIDPSLPAYAFAVSCKGGRAALSGHDATCILHAVYTLLERLGFGFEITGSRGPASVTLDDLNGWAVQVQPAVNQRGIRQHINFPMDISGYPLDEAKAYIRNLARLRLNHITFHSYPGQWYAVDLPGERRLAGAFFYGQRHDVPDHPVVKCAVRNAQTFCIPDIEPYYDQPEERSVRAVAWLQAVIGEAKRVGLTVQFSFELRDPDMDTALATCDAILKTYPAIDVLEIITSENGGWGEAVPAAALRALAAQYFGADILDDPAVARHLVEGQRSLDLVISELGHNIQVVKALQRRNDPKLPRLAVSVYCTVPAYLELALHLMRRFVPEGVAYAFLPQHGSRAVAKNVEAMALSRTDWARTMLYSWIEFDGLMYLQQNPLEGIRRLLALGQAVNGDAPITGICLNHWRTAENRTTARYAAVAGIDGPVDPAAFYRDYAASLELGAVDRYAAAMTQIDDADTQARDELPNIGFCYVGCWGDVGLGYYGRYEPDRLADVRRKYEAALPHLHACSEATVSKDGARYLALLVNRVGCTVTYLRAVEKAVELQPLCNDRAPADLSDAERWRVREICDEALALMEAYMALHAQAVVDRGCEGTLLSFYYTPPAVLKRIRREYGGAGQAESAPLETADEPPAPITWSGAG